MSWEDEMDVYLPDEEQEELLEFYDPNEDDWCFEDTNYVEVDVSELEKIIPIEDIVAIIASYLEDVGKEVYLDDEYEEKQNFRVIGIIGSMDERRIYFK